MKIFQLTFIFSITVVLLLSINLGYTKEVEKIGSADIRLPQIMLGVSTGYPCERLFDVGCFFLPNIGARFRGITTGARYMFQTGPIYRFCFKTVNPYVFADYMLVNDKFSRDITSVNDSTQSYSHTTTEYMHMFVLGGGFDFHIARELSIGPELGLMIPIDKTLSSKILKKYQDVSTKVDVSFYINFRLWI